MEKCELCGKPATGHCAQCGKALCQEHIEHGIQFRSNTPSINCPSCHENISKLNLKLVIGFGIGFIIIAIIFILYLNSIFEFF